MTSNGSVDDLYRCGVKLFVGPGSTLEAGACVPVFHRWIQTKVLDGLLIDVADYTHLSNGPQVVLVGHEGNLSVDDSGGRVGLVYSQKRPDDRRLADRLVAIVRTVATAGRLLEKDKGLARPVTFVGNKLAITPNDRRLIPANRDAAELMRPAVRTLADRLFPDCTSDIFIDAGSGNRLTFTVRYPAAVTVATLIERAS